jgi:peptidoglycan/LPS O-acetylase OafA/YrhL
MRTQRGGNFDLIRLVAASAVLLGHSQLMAAGVDWWNANPNTPMRQLAGDAVFVFFVVSGFLVSRSWRRDPHLGRFLARRLLRLMPGLGVLLLVTVILGGLLTTLTPGSYFASGSSWAYLVNALLVARLNQLPGVFLNSPATHQVNSSLWTLGYEFACYLAVAAVGVTAMLVRRRSLRVAMLLVVAVSVVALLMIGDRRIGPLGVPIAGAPVDMYLETTFLGQLGGYFLAGAVFERWQARIQLRALPAFVAAAMFVASSQVPVLYPLSVVALVYTVMYVALAAPRVARWATSRGDASYGIYIYGFLIQQLVTAMLGGSARTLTVFALSFPLALLAGHLSWRTVEHPALRRKPATPRIVADAGQPATRADTQTRPAPGDVRPLPQSVAAGV